MVSNVYLTQEEYKKLTLNQNDFASDDEFNKYLRNASYILDNLTNNYFQINSMEETNDYTVSRFKEALCAQIQYFKSVDGVNSAEADTPVNSISIGATSVSYGSKQSGQSTGDTTSTNTVSPDLKMLLANTGLLFRGI